MKSAFASRSIGSVPSFAEFFPVTDAADIESTCPGMHHCIQLTPGPISGYASRLTLGPITIYEHAVDRGVELSFAADPNVLTIGFLAEGERVIEGGIPWPRTHGLVAPQSDIELSTHGKSHIIWLRLDLGGVPEHELPEFDRNAEPFLAEDTHFVKVRQLIDMLSKASQTPHDFASRFRTLHFRSNIAQALSDALRRIVRSVRPASERKQRSLQLVRAVEAYMWENVEEPLTLERICKEVHCGVRALIYAFKDVYGVGPMTYWKARRLNGAHRKLCASGGGTPILEIAADFGFWHMGHFSADHKHMFGTTPSEAIASGITR